MGKSGKKIDRQNIADRPSAAVRLAASRIERDVFDARQKRMIHAARR